MEDVKQNLGASKSMDFASTEAKEVDDALNLALNLNGDDFDLDCCDVSRRTMTFHLLWEIRTQYS